MKYARTNLHKCNATAMIGVHVSLYLKHKAGEFVLCWLNCALLGLYRARRRGYLDKTVEQLLDAKSVERRTKEHRSNISAQVIGFLKFWINAIDQIQVFTKFLRVVSTNGLVDFGVVNIAYVNTLCHMLLIWLEQAQILFVDVVNALEMRSYVDWPAQRTNIYFQLLLQLIKNVKRVTSFAVKLVDKYYYRRVSHSAHFHKPPRLKLHTFCYINHNHNAVNRSECAIGVFCKILVAWSVKNVDFVTFVVKTHY